MEVNKYIEKYCNKEDICWHLLDAVTNLSQSEMLKVCRKCIYYKLNKYPL
jgi:hypothetical protein